MKLKFLGTRGYIEEKSKKHLMHSSLLVNRRVLFDWGKTWKGKLNQIKPKVIFITHAHPDHAGGLTSDIRIPVYASGKCFQQLKKLGLADLREIKPGRAIIQEGLRIMAYKVVHSLLAPAVGYRASDGKTTFIYNPDIISIEKKSKVLSGVDVYIGDGSVLKRSLIRRKGNKLFGHAAAFTQVNWCRAFGIKRAIFTHFGKGPVEMNEKDLKRRLREFGGGEVEVIAAYDGMETKI